MLPLNQHTSQQLPPAETLLVPLGATEQHGPHLPLGTDTIIAERWAEGVARQLANVSVTALVAPPLPYGSSGEHQAFSGTLSIGHEALELVLVELVRSAAHSFRRVVFLSGHAGNLAPVKDAVVKLRFEGHDVYCLFPTWDAKAERPVDAHAGRTETSLMLHLVPEQVAGDLAVPGQTKPLSEIMETLIADGVAAVSPTGILGDPTGANASEGRDLLEDLIERSVATLLAEWS